MEGFLLVLIYIFIKGMLFLLLIINITLLSTLEIVKSFIVTKVAKLMWGSSTCVHLLECFFD